MKETTVLLEVIRHVLCQKEIVIFSDVDVERLYRLAKSHSLEYLLSLAVEAGMFEATEEEKKRLTKATHQQMYKAIVQDAESELINKTLNDAQIPHLFLKGSVMKKVYPDFTLRSMADLDILVPKKSLKPIRNLMKGLGYTCEHLGGNHDVYHKKPFMNIEMHRAMIAESYSMSQYYKNIWSSLLQEENSYSYLMTNEDFYVYLIAHAIKHFQNGGTGVRSIIDLYLFKKAYPNLNFDYVEQELKKLEISKLATYLMDLAECWFGDQEATEEVAAIGEYIMRSGTYGSTEHSMITAGKLDSKLLFSSKLGYFLRKAFPSVRTMKSIYPSLKYLIFLLPLYYVVRVISLVFRRGGMAMSHMKTLNTMKPEQVVQVQKVMEMTQEDYQKE